MANNYHESEAPGRRIAEAIAHAAVDVIAYVRKVAVYLSLPFKFLQFFRQTLAEQNNKTNRDK